MDQPSQRLRSRALIGLSLLLGAVSLPSASPAGRGVADAAPGRVVAIGDVHGEADGFVALLRRLKLINDARQWTGGTTTLVQTGDFTDRGAKVRDVMDLLMALEVQAKAAGGRVLTLLGNHETMTLLGEVRDTTPEILASFADEQSEARREAAYQAYVKLLKSRPVGTTRSIVERDDWMAAHPVGFVEYRAAFGPDTEYGRWLRDKPVVAEVNGDIFMHAGIHPDLAPRKLDDINDAVRREIRQFDAVQRRLVERHVTLPFYTLAEIVQSAKAEYDAGMTVLSGGRIEGRNGGLFADPAFLQQLEGLLRIGTWSVINPNGPLWFRGFATWDPDEGAGHIEKLLSKYKARHFIVAHTIPATMRITPRFSSRVFLIDTGMLSSRYPGGRPSALDIVDGRYTAVYLDQSVTLIEPQTQGSGTSH